MYTIDLNCDMGEGLDNDAMLMPYISSANIGCGAHAGDASVMLQTVQLALTHNVTVGAHPGFNDRANFGRKEMQLSSREIYQLIADQVNSLRTIAEGAGAVLRHVKPHGALYNMSARDASVAAVIARSVTDIDPSLILFGLSGSHSITEAEKLGLQTASEVFADRSYQSDGSLTPRSQPGAMIESDAAAAEQVLYMISHQAVRALTGETVPVTAQTVCLHGDGEHAADFAKLVHHTLQQNNIEIKALQVRVV